MKSSVPVLLGATLLGAALAFPVLSLPSTTAVAPGTASQLALPAGQAIDKIAGTLSAASGEVEIVVQLSDPPLAVANGEDSKHVGGRLGRDQQITYTQGLEDHQNALLGKILALGGKEIGRVHIAYNAIIVRVDAAKLKSIAQMSEVLTIRPVGEYKLDLSTTVPYIGAAAVQAAGVDGTGVKVAVIDSGIDYTHHNLGGPGTVAAYQSAAGTVIGDPRATLPNALFPSGKVVGGYDFVGDAWPNGPRTEDPNPIDIQGHGTHVADIIAGKSTDGKHVGVAPGASLYAIKVCSSVATSCNGVALLLAIDFALDPNRDGSMDDAVDVINMSLGSAYGQIEDDLSAASANAVRAGVVVVAAAGNDGDRPYITSSPAATPEVISVAQTQVPTAVAVPLVITSPPAIAGTYGNTATIDWAPIDGGATGQVVFVGRGCLTGAGVPAGGDVLLANPAGKIALVDRGACNISEKVRRLSNAGALGVIVGLVAAGDAISFSSGGQCPGVPDGTCKPSLVVTQSTSNKIKGQLSAGVTASISQSNAVPLAGSMVSTSARGPNVSFNQIKPDIGAPGASVSAQVGTGTGETAFGGTSGATPMVAGSAALLLQAYPNRSPGEIKSLLMNTAATRIFTNPALLPGELAPITRIGGGEVRVDRAVASQTAAWDAERNTGSLSFGYHAVDDESLECRPVRVTNYSHFPRVYDVKSSFRFANDAASNAVSFQIPPLVFVGPHSSSSFPACIRINARKLPIWTLNGGSLGGTGSLLQSVEFDGYVSISDHTDDVHLAWQVLPHRAAAVHAERSSVRIAPNKTQGTVELENDSEALDGAVEVFSLTGTSPRLPKSQLPGPGSNFEIIDLAAVGARLVDLGGTFGLQFGITTYGQRAHPAYPGGFEVDIDTNGDGIADWFVFNAELGSSFAADGRTAVYVQKAGTTTARAFFFADADLNSSNIILTVPLAAIGLTPTSQFMFTVLAIDNYFTGNVTDSIQNMTYTAGVPKFFGSGLPATGVPAQGASLLTVERVPGGDVASPSQTGLLLLYRDAKRNREAETITVNTNTGDRD